MVSKSSKSFISLLKKSDSMHEKPAYDRFANSG